MFIAVACCGWCGVDSSMGLVVRLLSLRVLAFYAGALAETREQSCCGDTEHALTTVRVQANAKIADIAAGDTKLRCAVAVDHNSRPCLKYVCSCVLQVSGLRSHLGRGSTTLSSLQRCRTAT